MSESGVIQSHALLWDVSDSLIRCQWPKVVCEWRLSACVSCMLGHQWTCVHILDSSTKCVFPSAPKLWTKARPFMWNFFIWDPVFWNLRTIQLTGSIGTCLVNLPCDSRCFNFSCNTYLWCYLNLIKMCIHYVLLKLNDCFRSFLFLNFHIFICVRGR